MGVIKGQDRGSVARKRAGNFTKKSKPPEESVLKAGKTVDKKPKEAPKPYQKSWERYESFRGMYDLRDSPLYMSFENDSLLIDRSIFSFFS